VGARPGRRRGHSGAFSGLPPDATRCGENPRPGADDGGLAASNSAASTAASDGLTGLPSVGSATSRSGCVEGCVSVVRARPFWLYSPPDRGRHDAEWSGGGGRRGGTTASSGRGRPPTLSLDASSSGRFCRATSRLSLKRRPSPPWLGGTSVAGLTPNGDGAEPCHTGSKPSSGMVLLPLSAPAHGPEVLLSAAPCSTNARVPAA
jgi:hypothetical protein